MPVTVLRTSIGFRQVLVVLVVEVLVLAVFPLFVHSFVVHVVTHGLRLSLTEERAALRTLPVSAFGARAFPLLPLARLARCVAVVPAALGVGGRRRALGLHRAPHVPFDALLLEDTEQTV